MNYFYILHYNNHVIINKVHFVFVSLSVNFLKNIIFGCLCTLKETEAQN